MVTHSVAWFRLKPPVPVKLPDAPTLPPLSPSAGTRDAASITFRSGDGPDEHDVSTALIWDRVKVKLAGLPAHSSVTLRARMPGWPGATFESSATYVTDDNGRVDVAEQKPTGGTYTDADPDGVFWSMAPRQAAPGEQLPMDAVRFTIEAGGQTLAQADLTRTSMLPGVTRTDVRDNGLVGTLFLPPGKGPFPTIIAFGGSEGGLGTGEDMAAHFADRGYAALALAYFKGYDKTLPDTIPDNLENVPTEYFAKAIDYLETRPEVDRNRIGIMGDSRGGELALLLGSTMPRLHAVAALVPSHVVWQGMGADPNAAVPAWTTNGQPLPAVPFADDAVPEAFTIPDGPLAGKTAYNYAPAYLTSLSEAPSDQLTAATTKVENTNGPILMIGAAQDQMWPSPVMTTRAFERLMDQGHPYRDEMYVMPDAGHLAALWPGYPTTNLYVTYPDSIVSLGGTPAGTARAQRDSMEKIDRFFDGTFQNASH